MAIRFVDSYTDLPEPDNCAVWLYVTVTDYERYVKDYKSAYRRYHNGPVPSLEEYIRVRLTEENKNAD